MPLKWVSVGQKKSGFQDFSTLLQYVNENHQLTQTSHFCGDRSAQKKTSHDAWHPTESQIVTEW